MPQKRVLVFVGLITDPTMLPDGTDARAECSPDMIELFTKLSCLADQDQQSAYFQNAGEFLVQMDQLQARWIEPSTQTIDIAFKENLLSREKGPDTAHFKAESYQKFSVLDSCDRQLHEIPFQGTFGKDSVCFASTEGDFLLEQPYYPRDVPHEFSIQHVEQVPRRAPNPGRTPRFSARVNEELGQQYNMQPMSQSLVEVNRPSYDSSITISEAPEVLIKIRQRSKHVKQPSLSTMLERVLSRRQGITRCEMLAKSQTQKMLQNKQLLSPPCKCHRNSGSALGMVSPTRKMNHTPEGGNVNILLSKPRLTEPSKSKPRHPLRHSKASLLLHQSSSTLLQTQTGTEVSLLKNLKDKLTEIKGGRERSPLIPNKRNSHKREPSKQDKQDKHGLSSRLSPRDHLLSGQSFLTHTSKR